MPEVYTADSYYFDGERFRSPKLVGISDNLELLTKYLLGVRRYAAIVDPKYPDIDALNEIRSAFQWDEETLIAVASISKVQFSSENQMTAWLCGDIDKSNDTPREMFVLVPHDGGIDRKISRMSKKDSNSVWVPYIVEKIICEETEKFHSSLTVAKQTLMELWYYLSKDNSISQIKHISETIQDVSKFLKTPTDIESIICKRHPILFCDEPEYRAQIRLVCYERSLDKRYHSIINADE